MRPPCPTPSLETGREELGQEVWQQPWGKEPGPASVTGFLRDLHPALGRAGSAPRKRNLGKRRSGCAELPGLRGLQSTSPAGSGSARGAHSDLRGRQFGNDSISLTEGHAQGSGSSSPWQHAGSPHWAGGAGRSPESPPDAHIRAQEGVWPALSLGPELGAGSPGICQVPGRARAPDG